MLTIEKIHTYYQISFDYSNIPKGMINDIKRNVHKNSRRYCSETKKWYFNLYCLNDIKYVLGKYSQEYQIVDLGGETGVNTQEFKIEYVEQEQSRRYINMPYNLYLKNRYIAKIPYNIMEYYWINNPYNKPKPLAAEASNFYKLLEVNQTASTEEIKSNYRKLAKQFHPDISTEPDAHSLMIRINSAYSVLIDPLQRKKYDAGIALARMYAKPMQREPDYNGPPVLCGRIKATGEFSLGLFVINNIIKWQDIIKDGKIMTSHYNPLTKSYQINWDKLTN